ncbi:serine protease [Paenibacillus sp. TRM 82003]|nr:serine protease [Paenibacillus sp. TRM 82003]
MTDSNERKEAPVPTWDERYEYVENGREFSDEELDAMFRAADEEGEAPPPFFRSPKFKKIVAFVLAIMMCAQVMAFIPQIFSLPAIRFLSVSAQLSQSETIQGYKESVVVIRTDASKGTGFIVSEDGTIVTNRHVVDGPSAPRVHLADGSTYTAKIMSVDENVDIAVLDIDASALPTLPLAESYDGAEDTPVYIIGNPLFFNGIANEGVTWGLQPDRDPPMMALQAPIYKGNSGSPVIGRDGRVIGVVYATSSMEKDGESHRIGLAVPIEHVWAHLPR